jgi:hypothetical protein
MMEADARLIDLTIREAEAVISGDLQKMAALAMPLGDARIKRENAIVTLRHHVREHGC